MSAVVVTYNRQELLVASLEAVSAQTRPVDTILVVDNASTDDTARIVKTRFPGVVFHRLAENTGGAGGFAAGLPLPWPTAQTSCGCWTMTPFRDPDASVGASECRKTGTRVGSVGLVASRVIWTDGRDPSDEHAAPPSWRLPRPVAAASSVGCIPIRSASFVSVLVDASLTRQWDCLKPTIFLWNDDFEFTTRLLRTR